MSGKFALFIVICVLALAAETRAADVSHKSNAMISLKAQSKAMVLIGAPKPGSPAADGIEVFKTAGKFAPVVVRIWVQMAKIISKIPKTFRKVIMGIIWALLNIPANLFGMLKAGVKIFLKLGAKGLLKAGSKMAIKAAKNEAKDQVKEAAKDKAAEAAGVFLETTGVVAYNGDYYFDGVNEYNVNVFDFQTSAFGGMRMKSLKDKIKGGLKKVGGAVKKVGAIRDAIKKFFEKAIKKVVAAFKGVMDKLKPVMELGNKVLNFIDNFVKIPENDWKYMADIKNYGLTPDPAALPNIKADGKELAGILEEAGKTEGQPETKTATEDKPGKGNKPAKAPKGSSAKKAKFTAAYPIASEVKNILY